MRITKNRSASSLFFVALTTLIFAGCTHSSSSNIMDSKYSAPPRVAELPLAQALDSSMVPRGTMSLISGPLNSQLNVMN